MSEPDDSFTALQNTTQAYLAGTAQSTDVQQAIMDAVDGGNDPKMVADYVNGAAKPPKGATWFNPNRDQLDPPTTDILTDLSDTGIIDTSQLTQAERKELLAKDPSKAIPNAQTPPPDWDERYRHRGKDD